MTFAWPLALLLLLLLPFAGLAIAGLARWRRSRLEAWVGPHLLDRVLPPSVRRRRTFRDLALLVGFAGAVVALAEPRFATPPRTVRARGTDLVVLLDLSRSMDAQDVPPTRMVRARRELEDLQKVVAGDRIGLVIFAASAYARLPLTSDLRALNLVTAELSTDTFQNQGSNLGPAIDVGLELLSRTQDQAGKALLVLSDGETHHPEEALAAAAKAREAHVPVFAMGIGVEEATIPTRQGGVLKVGDEVVHTRPDFEILQQVAEISGGAFVNSTASSQDLEALYAELRRTVTAVERETRGTDDHDSAYQWPLALGVLGFLLAALVGDGRRFGALLVVVWVALSSAWAPNAWAASVEEADAAFRKKDWAEAARQLTELTREAPGDADLWDRLGAARYRAQDFEGAARAWDAAVGAGAGADAAYNAGNAHYQAGRLEDAVSRYDEALGLDAAHEGATHNRGVVTQEIAARRANKPPPPPKPDDGQKDGDGGDGQQDPNQAGGSQQGDDPNQSDQGQGDDPQQPQSEDQQGGGGDPGDPTGGQSQKDPGKDPSQGGQGQNDAPDGDPTQQDPNARGGGGGGVEGDPVPITEAQAERMIEGVEEGRPRTAVRGRPEDKPW